jgi:hypothetical protein
MTGRLTNPSCSSSAIAFASQLCELVELLEGEYLGQEQKE